MRFLLFRILLPAVLLGCAGLAMAAPPASARPLILAFSPLPPWRVVDADERPSGPYLEIMQHLAARAGLPLEVHVCPLVRCLDLLHRGDADVGIGVAPGPDREVYVEYLQPPFAGPTHMCFYRRRGDEASRVERYEDLARLRIGLTRGAHYFSRFDQDTALNKDVAPDKLSNLRKLVNLRVDVAIMVCGEGKLLANRPEFRHRIELAGPEVRTGPRFVVLSRQSALHDRKADLQRALQQMVVSGEIRRLLAPIER
jgi:polar amino acid transport system substrate-binding protein